MATTMDCPETPELLSQCGRSRTPSPPPPTTVKPKREATTTTTTPPPGDRRQCSICLGKVENESHTDRCDHRFCFTCLLEWSKVNNVCPLCKQRFALILGDRESYRLPERPPPPRHDFDVEFVGYEQQQQQHLRSSYERTIGQLVMQRLAGPSSFAWFPVPGATRGRSRLASSDFRRSIYDSNLYVRPESVVDGVTGRYRETGPAWYRANPAQTHRLVPWLNRELNALRTVQPHHIPHVLQAVLEFVRQYTITGPDFRAAAEPYVGSRTAHFQHEFHNFARSVFDMVGYDREAAYGPPPPADELPAETFVVSSDSSSSGDGDEGEDVVVAASYSLPSTSNGFAPPGTVYNNDTIVIEDDEGEDDDVQIVDQVQGLPVVIDLNSTDGEDEPTLRRSKGKGKGKSSQRRFEGSSKRKRRRRGASSSSSSSDDDSADEDRPLSRMRRRKEPADLVVVKKPPTSEDDDDATTDAKVDSSVWITPAEDQPTSSRRIVSLVPSSAEASKPEKKRRRSKKKRKRADSSDDDAAAGCDRKRRKKKKKKKSKRSKEKRKMVVVSSSSSSSGGGDATTEAGDSDADLRVRLNRLKRKAAPPE